MRDDMESFKNPALVYPFGVPKVEDTTSCSTGRLVLAELATLCLLMLLVKPCDVC